jgi:hypothetical protein
MCNRVGGFAVAAVPRPGRGLQHLHYALLLLDPRLHGFDVLAHELCSGAKLHPINLACSPGQWSAGATGGETRAQPQRTGRTVAGGVKRRMSLFANGVPRTAMGFNTRGDAASVGIPPSSSTYAAADLLTNCWLERKVDVVVKISTRGPWCGESQFFYIKMRGACRALTFS